MIRLTAGMKALSQWRPSLRFGKLRGRHEWCAIGIGEHHLLGAVVAAPARKGELPRVLNIAMLERDSSNPALQPALLTAMAAQLAHPGCPYVLLLPRDDYRVSVVPEPAVPASELAQSVRWQLAPILDFPIEEAVVEYMSIPTQTWQPDKTQELYAIAAKSSVMAQYADDFREARLALQAIDIRETAQRHIAALAEQADEVLGMVSFGERHVQITFTWHGELYMDRLIAEPVASIDDNPDRRAAIYARILLQIQRSVDAVHNSLPFLQLGRILVAGAPPDFCAQLATSVSEPVEVLTLDTLFNLSKTPALRDPAVGMRYFAVLGAALRGMEKTS